MLHAGYGFQSRLRGLSVDNLVEVEMVLADGRIIVASKDNYPGMFLILFHYVSVKAKSIEHDIVNKIYGGGYEALELR